jgi:hypothetical protein
MRFRRQSVKGSPPHPLAATCGEYFQLGQVRLYQPDSVLQERLPEPAKLASYCKTLTWVGTEYFGGLGQNFGIWAEAARAAGRAFEIPDTLFEVVFAD